MLFLFLYVSNRLYELNENPLYFCIKKTNTNPALVFQIHVFRNFLFKFLQDLNFNENRLPYKIIIGAFPSIYDEMRHK
jgi:hypothetical protein